MQTPAPPRFHAFERLVPRELRPSLERAAEVKAGLGSAAFWAEALIGDLPPRFTRSLETALARIDSEIGAILAAYHRGEVSIAAAKAAIAVACDPLHMDLPDVDLDTFRESMRGH